MKREYVALFEPDGDGWTASVPDLPGCFSEGSTLVEAQENIREAISLWIEIAKEKGWPVPPPRAEIKRIAG